MSSQVERLNKLYADVESLEVLGRNAVLRRALDLIAAEVNEAAGTTLRRQCEERISEREARATEETGDVFFQSDRGRLFLRTVRENRADDQRRSIMLNQKEHLAQNFIDLFSGRLSTLEVSFENKEDLEMAMEAQQIAQNFVSIYLGKLKVKIHDLNNIPSIIDDLRSCAYYLEKIHSGEIETDFVGRKPIAGHRSSAKCHFVETEMGERRWKNNGTILEQEVHDSYWCSEIDYCCHNGGWWEERNSRWQTVWNHHENPSKKPPVAPPNFIEHSWDNKCAVFNGPMGRVSSDYGWRNITGNIDFHPAIDIVVPVGTPVRSTTNGTVRHATRDPGNGISGVHIQSGADVYVYWHVDASVKKDDVVKAGDIIGVTGNYAQPHLHYARYRPPNGDNSKITDGNSLNPCP